MIGLRSRLRRLSGEQSPFQPEPALENVYRHLFTRDLAAFDEPDTFYPTGGAANYSLLYLIQRIANDLRPKSILDIGAGQTTLLWNMFHRHGTVGKVTTLEHDAEWGDSIGAQVDHEVLVTPLQPSRIGTVRTNTYDWEKVMARGPYDAVVCDGPIGARRFSRYGIISLLSADLPDDFVLVLDDAERSGEQDTIRAIHERFSQLGRPYKAGVVRAAKSQAIFATGAYSAICYV